MQLNRVGELGNFIRDQRRNARLSLRKLSSMAGISNPYLSQIERGLRRPSAEILQAIAKALRISAETLYVKAGILEERGDATDPVTAILRDLTLSEKQKQVLVEVYQSFHHGNDSGLQPDPTAVRAVALAKTTPQQATAPKAATPKRTSRAPKKSAAKKPGARKKPAATRKPAKKPTSKRRPAKRTTSKRTTGRRTTAGTRSTKRTSATKRRTSPKRAVKKRPTTRARKRR